MTVDGRPWTGDDVPHNLRCHERWLRRLNRVTGEPGYHDRWYAEQCGGCRFWIALRGEAGLDYGACTNAESPFDGHVRFEHDGCAAFVERADGSFG